MRTITDHVIPGDTANQLRIEVVDEPGQGGACHEYSVKVTDDKGIFDREMGHVSFQNGPIKEYGVNGITQEALLAIVIDRLRSFQAGPFACEANATAMEHAQFALYHLQTRTRDRLARGVEGTNKQ